MEKLLVGQPAPDFAVPNEHGQQVTKQCLKGKKAILYFYPKDQTPGCTIEARDFRMHAEAFANAGYVVYGISRDSEESHCRFIEKEELNFHLLSDVEGYMCNAYDVLRRRYENGRIGIERSTFVLDEAGVLVKVYRELQAKGHVAFLMNELGIKGE